MPGYVSEALIKFQHASKEVRYYGPSPYTPPQFGKKMKMAKVDTTASMDTKEVQLLRQVCGTYLYCNVRSRIKFWTKLPKSTIALMEIAF